jgi:error-prone DNA polymerase
MIACRGKLQQESGVIHVVAEHLTDLSGLLRSVGDRDDQPFPLPHGRGDEARHGSQPDSRDRPRPRDIYLPDLDIRTGKGIKVPTRDFR